MTTDPLPPIPGFGSKRREAFLEGTRDAAPRQLLVSSLSLVTPGSRALDVGCGPGRETVAMLRHGLRVLAIDPDESMLHLARATIDEGCPESRDRVDLQSTTLEQLAPHLGPAAFALVHAGFVLPFVRARDFASVFARLRSALQPGGVLVAQFFGPDDEFIRETGTADMSAHTATELDDLLRGLEILHRDEVNRSGFVGRRVPKWWHVHHIVARAPFAAAPRSR